MNIQRNNSMEDNMSFINKTSRILDDNPQWEDVYSGYAESLTKNKGKYLSNGKLFRVKKPLLVYSSLGKVKTDAGSTCYDLRFAGQSIGEISVNREGKVHLSVDANQAKYAKEHFGFIASDELKRVDWKGYKSSEFRKFYYAISSIEGVGIKSEEHRIESFLLKEFSKKTRLEDKKLCNIQPVRLGNKFFQLTTPIKASTHNPEFSMNSRGGATGGGIDILSRIRHSNNESRIAVMELKDQNKSSEPQRDAMFQALTYATFLAYLFRSKSGKTWWNLMRPESANDEKAVPKHLDIDVVTIMPKKGCSMEGDLNAIDVLHLNTTFHLYTLYYDVDSNGNPCQFTGTLTNNIL